MQSAGVTLVQGDLRGILRARLPSQATMNNIKQNLFCTFFYNTLGVPIAAGVLYTFFGFSFRGVECFAAAKSAGFWYLMMRARRPDRADGLKYS